MYEIPTTLLIGGQEYPIRNKGDFRMVLDCFQALEDVELSKSERIVTAMVIFYDGMESVSDLNKFDNLEEAVKQMYDFFNCGHQEDLGSHSNYKLIDWDKDQQLITSAINNIIGEEIRFKEYVHWWTFMSYYMAIGECPLSNIVGIRSKLVKGKPLEKHEREFKRDNPQYFIWDKNSIEQKEAEDWVRQVWNNGGE